MDGTRETGQRAEQEALRQLQSEGLTLVAQNQRYRCGELDLIMRDQTHLIFIEVRYRRRSDYGGAAASVTWGKQQRLIRAAQCFLQQHPHWRDTPCRFDVVALAPSTNGWRFDWLRNAFGA